jgi:hypothetical protein
MDFAFLARQKRMTIGNQDFTSICCSTTGGLRA